MRLIHDHQGVVLERVPQVVLVPAELGIAGELLVGDRFDKKLIIVEELRPGGISE